MAKFCPNCKNTFLRPEKHFNTDKSRKDGLCVYCKTCARQLTKWYEEKGKPPKDKRTCAYSKCNNTFETRIKRKKYCCGSCNSKAYQEKKGLEEVRFRSTFLKKLRRKKEVKPNGRTPWSSADINTLMEMTNSGKKRKDISKALGRSYEACLSKYSKLVKEEKEKYVFDYTI